MDCPVLDCPVCIEHFEIKDMYTINCKSTVPHRLCHPCETKLRLTMEVSADGRLLKCPVCRTVEKEPGNRSASSLQTELKSVYSRMSRISQVDRSDRERLDLQNRQYIERLSQQRERERREQEDQQARNRRYAILLSQISSQTPVRVIPQAPVRVTPPAPPAPAPAPTVHRTEWCQSGLRQLGTCLTAGKTPRKCSYPAGCNRKVCRSCNMCISHFEF